MGAHMRIRYTKYSKYANKIRSIKNPTIEKSKFGFQSNKPVEQLDEKQTIDECILLFNEIKNNFDVSKIKNKSWFKLIEHYATLKK